ncbi:MAG: BMP family ABC transporter substrate-binding protein [Lachnospiraceae bacterium]|nr:BMP family ABC transporter substrate-binding protein [Lachnospiraceae bacterium]
MKKKLFAVVMTAVMAVSMAACGGSNTASSTANDTTDVSVMEDVTATVVEAGEPVAAEDIKVGLICVEDENSGYDASHIEGITKACEDLGIDTATQLIIKKDIPEDESCYDNAVDLAEEGCTIIFSDSYGHQSYMQEAASEYPDIIFVAATGDMAATTGLGNFKNIFPHTFESRYVSGIVAGMKLAEMMAEDSSLDPYVGYIGAYPYAEVVSGYTAFFLGVRSIVPEAHMDVQYTNSWYDPTAEGAAAEALMSKGCAIISAHADSTGAPSAVQAASKNGKKVFCVGYNIDMRSVAPDAALTSAQNNWSVLYKHMLDCVIKGEPVPVDYSVGADQDAVMISELGDACAEGTAEAVEAAWKGIKDGSIQVFDTATFTCPAAEDGSYTVDENGVVTSAYGLDADGDFVNDNGEAIVDGAFVESELRSAPYFSLRIDGITELN